MKHLVRQVLERFVESDAKPLMNVACECARRAMVAEDRGSVDCGLISKAHAALLGRQLYDLNGFLI